MQKAFLYFFSMGFALILMLIFAFASGVATIIESIAGSEAAWAIVYGTNWFGFVQLLIVINLAYNIYRYKLYQYKKLPAFLFHISFIFIFLGALITRYAGFEGTMHIRENAKSNEVSTREVSIQLTSKDSSGKEIEKSLSKYINPNGSGNRFTLTLPLDDKKAQLSYKGLVSNGVLRWVESKDGRPVVELLFSDDNNKRLISLKDGEILEIGDIDLTFNTKPKQKKYIEVSLKDGRFYIKTNQDIDYINMTDINQGKVKLEKDINLPLDTKDLYTIDGVNFVAKTLLAKGIRKVLQVPSSEIGTNALKATLSYNGETKEVFTFFGDFPRTFKVGGKDFMLAWGTKTITLPFSLYLKDFKIDRYPGSNSPSGYSSDVIVKDGVKELEHKIFMNNVLDYDGYRFFQSSYDPDEGGTILSVNKDPGKWPTYIGYFLLTLGMLLNLFNPNSRFLKLSKMIDKSAKRDKLEKSSVVSKDDASKAQTIKLAKTGKILALLLVVSLASFFTPSLQASTLPIIDKTHVKHLETLVVQGYDGRMEPFDTLARDVLQKVHRSDTYKGQSASLVMLSIMINPESWKSVPFIKVSDKELKKLLGINPKANYASFDNFYGLDPNKGIYYKLGKVAEEVNRKPPGNRSKFDKDVIKVDERFNVFNLALIGELFKVLPKENDLNNKWISPNEAMMDLSGSEGKNARALVNNYFASVINAEKSGDWSKANNALSALKSYQGTVGHAVLPSLTKLNYEVFFNQAKVFERLMPIYLIAGFLLLIFVFLRMMNPKLNMNLAFKVIYTINILAFVVHTLGLILRWYVSEHAPWSNAYESLVYIAWALSLSGVVFSRTSAISLSLTSILAGITLFVANLSHIDPQITPLQPVLNSYWLTIHVSVITASYGFLGLGSLLGFFTLILFILQKPKAKSELKNTEVSRNIIEATRINEMSLILGLCLLTVGNFLGGIWANESWGRYWGWDSKETWSLVTILVYACVIHMRFIPRVNSQYWFAVASMFAYACVIMTYFGVNFYLTGMHSYAAGESVPVPSAVWIAALVMIVLAVAAYFKRGYSTRL
ncbi:cytochrome c biogenesis protein CcsA [Helicobacter sp. 11S02629-2]|uniref:cytochrome c biogenesis protein n=1 Tax=Helicobacter sp. 11S02629-2 TaxID=1476195 RepID=UPI000BA6D99B|nr:cytochrome c biogenesis protein CcsA [Helicobacter sp. 11S02629-2]PAF44369.1 hypothetical protein BKH40_05595 [Helicobacter sp. 11S02629-2]